MAAAAPQTQDLLGFLNQQIPQDEEINFDSISKNLWRHLLAGLDEDITPEDLERLCGYWIRLKNSYSSYDMRRQEISPGSFQRLLIQFGQFLTSKILDLACVENPNFETFDPNTLQFIKDTKDLGMEWSWIRFIGMRKDRLVETELLQRLKFSPSTARGTPPSDVSAVTTHGGGAGAAATAHSGGGAAGATADDSSLENRIALLRAILDTEHPHPIYAALNQHVGPIGSVREALRKAVAGRISIPPTETGVIERLRALLAALEFERDFLVKHMQENFETLIDSIYTGLFIRFKKPTYRTPTTWEQKFQYILSIHQHMDTTLEQQYICIIAIRLILQKVPSEKLHDFFHNESFLVDSKATMYPKAFALYEQQHLVDAWKSHLMRNIEDHSDYVEHLYYLTAPETTVDLDTISAHNIVRLEIQKHEFLLFYQRQDDRLLNPLLLKILQRELFMIRAEYLRILNQRQVDVSNIDLRLLVKALSTRKQGQELTGDQTNETEYFAIFNQCWESRPEELHNILQENIWYPQANGKLIPIPAWIAINLGGASITTPSEYSTSRFFRQRDTTAPRDETIHEDRFREVLLKMFGLEINGLTGQPVIRNTDNYIAGVTAIFTSWNAMDEKLKQSPAISHIMRIAMTLIVEDWIERSALVLGHTTVPNADLFYKTPSADLLLQENTAHLLYDIFKEEMKNNPMWYRPYLTYTLNMTQKIGILLNQYPQAQQKLHALYKLYGGQDEDLTNPPECLGLSSGGAAAGASVEMGTMRLPR